MLREVRYVKLGSTCGVGETYTGKVGRLTESACWDDQERGGIIIESMSLTQHVVK